MIGKPPALACRSTLAAAHNDSRQLGLTHRRVATGAGGFDVRDDKLVIDMLVGDLQRTSSTQVAMFTPPPHPVVASASACPRP
jgi:hypothetical protein